MSEPTIVAYDDALRVTGGRRRHLLLGNGFSIAARSQFHYDALKAAAGQNIATDSVFAGFEDENFEEVMAALKNSLHQGHAVDDVAGLARIELQIADLRKLLVRTVALVHPDSSFVMKADELRSCSDFLKQYIGRAVARPGIVFTVNYDLLLYWTVVMFGSRREGRELTFYDGFQGDDWLESRMRNENLTVAYLHGSLHIFERDLGTKRIRYQHGPTPRNLLSQIREALEAGDLPVFVSGGTPKEKADRIAASHYLREGLRRFRFACQDARDSLFTVGHSLSDQDEHLTNLIGHGRIGRVFIGAYGGRGSPDGNRAEQLAVEWQRMRSQAPRSHPLEVSIFDSKECGIWSRFDQVTETAPA